MRIRWRQFLQLLALACCLLVAFCLSWEPAWAQTVTKQKGCNLMMEGLESAKKGQVITLEASDGTTHKAKILGMSKKTGKGKAKLAKKSCSADLSGASASGGGGGNSGSGSDGSGGSSGGKGLHGFQAYLDVGYTMLEKAGAADDKVPPIEQNMNFGGYDLGAFGAFKLGLSKSLSIPIGVGAGYIMSSGELLDEDGNPYKTATMDVMYARVALGVQFSLPSGLSFGLLPFFDYGFSGTLATELASGVVSDAANAVNESSDDIGFMRYGAGVTAGYNVGKGFLVGMAFRYGMGNVSATVAESSVASDVSGWVGSLIIGYEK